jgi:ornithine cyclodeaminase/alanine dehydrogenase-like protein (mu-crystallin family)
VIPYLSAADIAARMGYVEAADALEAALDGGLDPDADPERGVVPSGAGHLLVMPSAAPGTLAVKLVTVGGEPRIQGVCVVFDPVTLAPVAIVDGAALTLLRTAGLSALAARRLAAPDARRLLVFGRGPQGLAHAEAIRAVLPTIEEVTFVGRDDEAPIEEADVICCCTTARAPLFAGERVGADAAVIAIGSHEPEAAELDASLIRRADVYVESRRGALHDAGDVIRAGLGESDLTPLTDPWTPDRSRPRVFKSTGMAWEDAVVASALVADQAQVP